MADILEKETNVYMASDPGDLIIRESSKKKCVLRSVRGEASLAGVPRLPAWVGAEGIF